MLYLLKKWNANLGIIIANKPSPAAPQTGAPIVQTCNALNPIIEKINAIIDLLVCFLTFIFSLIFLTIQVIVSAKVKTKAIAKTKYHL